MSADTLMDEIANLSNTLMESEERIGELQDLLKSFSGVSEAGFVPLALPDDFSFEETTSELNRLLQERHSNAVAYKQLCERQQAEKAAETKRELDALKTRYKATIVRLLQSAISLGAAVTDAHNLRMAARDLTGRTSELRHIGPACDAANPWDLADPCSWPSIWAREAVEYGLVDADAEWLAPLNMTGGVRLGVR